MKNTVKLFFREINLLDGDKEVGGEFDNGDCWLAMVLISPEAIEGVIAPVVICAIKAGFMKLFKTAGLDCIWGLAK